MAKSPKVYRLETHSLRHLRIFQILLIFPLINFHIHFINFVTVGAVFTRTVFSTLDSFSVTRTVLFVTLCLFACAISKSVLFNCLESRIPFFTVVLIFAWFASTFFRTKLTVLEAFTVRFQAFRIFTITIKGLGGFELHLVCILIRYLKLVWGVFIGRVEIALRVIEGGFEGEVFDLDAFATTSAFNADLVFGRKTPTLTLQTVLKTGTLMIDLYLIFGSQDFGVSLIFVFVQWVRSILIGLRIYYTGRTLRGLFFGL